MIAGRLLLTDFRVDAEIVTLKDPNEQREVIGVIAALFNKQGIPTATITLPLDPENAIDLIVKIAELLDPDEHSDLLSKLSVKGSGILLAKPGDEKTAAENLGNVRTLRPA